LALVAGPKVTTAFDVRPWSAVVPGGIVGIHRPASRGFTMTVDPSPASGVSRAFEAFFTEAPRHADAWMAATRGLTEASALDPKTLSLAYLAVLAALRLDSGVPFHVQRAKDAGASRAEVISAILVGLQPAGHGVTACLPAAVAAYAAAP
jgi:alkylhydroperoxidase/carboxymuconolactone decarboxylase family protein YurZ